MHGEIYPLFGLRNPVSSVSHLFGVIASLFALRYFWTRPRISTTHRCLLAVFALSSSVLYAASFVFHGLTLPRERLIPYQLFDQSAIYLLIVGTTTPIAGILPSSQLCRVTIMAAMWGLALAGIACKWVFFYLPYWLVVAPYVALGWLAFLSLLTTYDKVGVAGLKWVVVGGLLYTIGAILDAKGWPRLIPGIVEAHEVFHVLTLAGTSVHFLFIYRYVLPHARRAISASTLPHGSPWPSRLYAPPSPPASRPQLPARSRQTLL